MASNHLGMTLRDGAASVLAADCSRLGYFSLEELLRYMPQMKLIELLARTTANGKMGLVYQAKLQERLIGRRADELLRGEGLKDLDDLLRVAERVVGSCWGQSGAGGPAAAHGRLDAGNCGASPSR